MEQVALESIASRVRSEFLEQPGLVLTKVQAKKLFGLRDDHTTDRVLGHLIERKFLMRAHDGSIRRRQA